MRTEIMCFTEYNGEKNSMLNIKMMKQKFQN